MRPQRVRIGILIALAGPVRYRRADERLAMDSFSRRGPSRRFRSRKSVFEKCVDVPEVPENRG